MAYIAPASDGPVVSLLDESVEPLLSHLLNDYGGILPAATREDRDVFAGVEAARVAPQQRYSARVPGWNYRIVEKPTKPGEFRYVRFAWKKIGGNGAMMQISTDRGWEQRYVAGQNSVSWNAKSVSDRSPTEWQVVTRDFFKDFGAMTIVGFAITPMDGTALLFDHFLLGRSIEDLDKATDAALGRAKLAKPLEGAERDAAWRELWGQDRGKAAAALRKFLATSPEQVEYIATHLPKTDPQVHSRVLHLIKDLDAMDFDIRQKASDELVKIGPPAVDLLRTAMQTSPSDEVRYRAEEVLVGKVGSGHALSRSALGSRVIRVLERAGTEESKKLLSKLADGVYGPDYVEDAKAATQRLAK